MPSLFYDLHVCEGQLEPQTQRERLALALRLGWDGVALVHQARAATLGDADRWAGAWRRSFTATRGLGQVGAEGRPRTLCRHAPSPTP